MLAVCCACALSLPAYAQDEVHTQKIDNKGSSVIGLSGSIKASIISAEVTLSSYFTIDPNQEDESKRFQSATMTVRNTSMVPIEVQAVSMKAASSNAPRVVNPARYSDSEWAALGKRDTTASIALALHDTDGQAVWFPGEGETPTPATFATLRGKDSTSGSAIETRLQAKHGLAWPDNENFKYEMVLSLKLKDETMTSAGVSDAANPLTEKASVTFSNLPADADPGKTEVLLFDSAGNSTTVPDEYKIDTATYAVSDLLSPGQKYTLQAIFKDSGGDVVDVVERGLFQLGAPQVIDIGAPSSRARSVNPDYAVLASWQSVEGASGYTVAVDGVSETLSTGPNETAADIASLLKALGSGNASVRVIARGGQTLDGFFTLSTAGEPRDYAIKSFPAPAGFALDTGSNTAGWNAVEGAESYLLTITHPDGAIYQVPVSGTSVSLTADGATGIGAAGDYSMTVKAAGASSEYISVDESEPIRFTRLSAPDGVEASLSRNDVSVSWSGPARADAQLTCEGETVYSGELQSGASLNGYLSKGGAYALNIRHKGDDPALIEAGQAPATLSSDTVSKTIRPVGRDVFVLPTLSLDGLGSTPGSGIDGGHLDAAGEPLAAAVWSAAGFEGDFAGEFQIQLFRSAVADGEPDPNPAADALADSTYTASPNDGLLELVTDESRGLRGIDRTSAVPLYYRLRARASADFEHGYLPVGVVGVCETAGELNDFSIGEISTGTE